jgi:Flp pilus assembly protein TadB
MAGLVWAFAFAKRGRHHTPQFNHSPRAKTMGEDDGNAQRRIRKLTLPVLFGLLCVLITRWPVAGILGGLAAATLPSSLRKVLPGEASRKTEAVAIWTESIRDSLAASAGLSQAIVVTAPAAPIPIRTHVVALAQRLTNGVPLAGALRAFAHEVDDPAAEFLACALLLAATSRAQKLVEVLSSLAESIREDVSMRLRVDASRASARSSVRTVVVFSVVFAGALVLIAHSYLSPFGSAAGQLVLAVVGLFYAAGLALMVRLVRPTPEMRLLEVGRGG